MGFVTDQGEDADLCSTKHHPIQQYLQLFERSLTGTGHSILLDGCQDLVIPETRLEHG